MASSDSDFEPPQITSTQISPKKVNSMEKRAFENKMKGMNINNLLKSKAIMALAKNNSVAQQSSRLQLIHTIKKKHMDDERDSSYYSSNEAKKINSKHDSSSSDESSSDDGHPKNNQTRNDSQSESESGSDKESNEKTHQREKSSSEVSTSCDVNKSHTSSDENSDCTNIRRKKWTKHWPNNVKSQKGLNDSEDEQNKNKPKVNEVKKIKKKEEISSSGSDSESSNSSESGSSSDDSSSEEEIYQKSPIVVTGSKTYRKDAKLKNSDKNNKSDTSFDSESDSSTGSDSSSTTASSSDDSDNEENEIKGKQKAAGLIGEHQNDVTDKDYNSDTQLNMSLNTTRYVATRHTQKIQADYVDMYHLEAAPLQGAFNIGNITEDDEVFCLKVENDIDPMSLLKLKIAFERKQTLVLKNKTAEVDKTENIMVEFDRDDRDKLCVLANTLGEFGITHLQTQGSITVSENRRIENAKPVTVEFRKKEKFPFPTEKLRTRHPLLGRSFEKKIVLDKHVAKKLANSELNKSLETKGKRRSKSKEQQLDSTNDSVKKSKKKKKKHCDDSMDDFKSPPTAMQTATNKKLLKLMSSTMNSPSIHKAIFEPDESVITTHKKKKKKDKSKDRETLMNMIETSLVEPTKQDSPSKKLKSDKNRKRRHSEALVESPPPVEKDKDKSKIKKRKPTIA